MFTIFHVQGTAGALEHDAQLAEPVGGVSSTNPSNGIYNGLVWAFSAYSARTDNEITDNAPIYVNYGRLEDYESLKNRPSGNSINTNDKIHIVRYGKIPASEKVANAIKNEARGLILYDDPVELLDRNPNAWWLNKNGIVRESVLNLPGDPQTPGWPTLRRVHKIPEVRLINLIANMNHLFHPIFFI